MNMIRSRATVACAALVLAGVAAACGSGDGGGGAATAAPTGAPATSSHLVATRWWSNSAARAGSLINPKDPESAATKLHTSPRDYCGMLRQTLAAGHTILPNVTANDPALLTSTKAFVAELEAVAPSDLAGSWKVLGSAVLTFVQSGGDSTKVQGIDAAAVRAAASTVAADAKRSCGVDLS
jgi:hypothetical protein